jgi:hypothetical protein
MPLASLPALSDSSSRLFGTRAQGSGAGTAEQSAGVMPFLSFTSRPLLRQKGDRASVPSGTKCEGARTGRLVGCRVGFHRASQSESPLPHLLARCPTSQTGILSSSSALSGVMRHKVPRDTDTPDCT